MKIRLFFSLAALLLAAIIFSTASCDSAPPAQKSLTKAQQVEQALTTAKTLDDTLAAHGYPTLDEIKGAATNGTVTRVTNLPIPEEHSIRSLGGMISAGKGTLFSPLMETAVVPYACTYIYEVGDTTCLAFMYVGGKLGFRAHAVSVFAGKFNGTLPKDAIVTVEKMDAANFHSGGSLEDAFDDINE